MTFSREVRALHDVSGKSQFVKSVPVKIDAALLPASLADAGPTAHRLEALGYDGAFTFEGPHDPFLPLALAAQATERLELSTAIAVAFARNPMLLAYLGWDLQTLARGRFILGLGSQIRAHVEKCFGMPWSRPAARMRELVLAIRAIWRCWSERERLDFRGDFYQHTLMTPFFDPGPNAFGSPPIFLAGVGPRMTEVAGEVADGFFVHPLHTRCSWRETTLPALERGLSRAGRTRADLEVAVQLMVVSGADDAERETADRFVRQQIAFYGSTPAYRVVLEAHRFGELQPQLNRLSKQGRWDDMASLVPDELLELVAVRAPLDQLAEAVRERCGDFADRVSLVAPYAADPARWATAVQSLRGARPEGEGQ